MNVYHAALKEVTMGEIQVRPLFNPNGDTDKSKKRIINGETTNLQEFNNPKYEWASKWYRASMNNFWIPESISMSQDVTDYRNLPTEYRESLNKILSFLIFLDSLQTANLPNINDYITASEVNLCLTLQTADEAIHSQSYSYILDSICNPTEQQSILYQWKDDPLLLKRVSFIGGLYNDFIENPTDFGLVKTCFANFILEGIYFYSGFAFIYALGRLGKMNGTVQEIRYINKDELTHVTLFRNILAEMRTENPHLFTTENIEDLRQMMATAVETEIEWGKYVVGDKIDGLNRNLIELYIKHLANERLKMLDISPLFPEVDKDPLPWVAKFASSNMIKSDFFEAHPTAYTKAAAVKDDL
jgi:ribonucleoside-diphosphate reductase beta chain